MAVKYKLKRPEALDALASAAISTAAGLAEKSRLSRATAQAVMRGDSVSFATAVHVSSSINKSGGNAVFSEVFEEVAE